MPDFSDLASPSPSPRPDADRDRGTVLARPADRVRPVWADDLAARLAGCTGLAIALAAVAVVAGMFWYRAGVAVHGTPGGARTSSRSASDASGVAASSRRERAVETTVESVTVHVSGAVARPGLYHLAAGARVADAITAAGGTTADAEPDRINLAARVADGQHVVVPRVGQPLDPAGATSSAGDPTTGPVNLNTAGTAELERLPHIGPTLARAIVDYRTQHGRFRSVHDLRNVRGIGERVYADLVEHVAV